MKLNLNREITFFNNVGFLDKLIFSRELSLMLKSGITLFEGLDILGKQSKSGSFKKIIHNIYRDVTNGQPLYKALEKYPRVFNKFYTHMVKIGEESGNLVENLDFLAKQMKKSYEFNGKVRQALTYPTIVLTLAVVVGFGLSVFALPKLVDLFQSLDIQLPLSTRILLYFALIMKNYGTYIAIGVISAVILFRLLISTRQVKPYWQNFLLSIPRLGYVLQAIELSSLFRNLGIMLNAGIPISLALEAQKDTTANLVYQQYLEFILKGVEKGKTIEDVLESRKIRFIPLVAVRMVGVGEQTGKLAETCLYLGDFFEEEVDQASKDFNTILEPFVLIIVGLIVGFIAISIIAPIYQFTGSIQR